MDPGTSLPIVARLPFEIYDAILKQLPTVDESGASTIRCLYPTLFISRVWRAAAELRIYSTVDLPPLALLPFARTVLARPDLAARITALRFSVVGKYSSLTQEYPIIDMMFKNLNRLTDLHTFRPFEAGRELLIFPSDDNLLLGATFRLTRLICTFRWSEGLVDVLREQSELREFALSDHGSVHALIDPSQRIVINDQLFPHCTRMVLVPHVLESLTYVPPALTNLLFRLNVAAFSDPVMTKDTAKELRRLKETLRVLHIERTATSEVENYPPAKLIKCFAPQLSRLVFFGLEDSMIYSPRDHREVRNAICEHLTNLRVLVWAPARLPLRVAWTALSGEGSSTSSDDEEHAGQKMEDYVRTYFNRIPALRIFVVSGYYRTPVIWRRGGDSESVTLTKCRAAAPFISDWYAEIDPEDPCAFFNPTPPSR